MQIELWHSLEKEPYREDGKNEADEVCGESYRNGVTSIFDAHGAEINCYSVEGGFCRSHHDGGDATWKAIWSTGLKN